MIEIVSAYVAGRRGLSVQDMQEWKKDLARSGREGAYFFSLNRYVFLAGKRR